MPAQRASFRLGGPVASSHLPPRQTPTPRALSWTLGGAWAGVRFAFPAPGRAVAKTPVGRRRALFGPRDAAPLTMWRSRRAPSRSDAPLLPTPSLVAVRALREPPLPERAPSVESLSVDEASLAWAEALLDRIDGALWTAA